VDEQQKVLREIQDKVQQINTFLARRERLGNRLTMISTLSAGLAALLTALAAVFGVVAAGSASTGWRILLGVATVLSGGAAIATNLYKSRDIAAQLSKAQAGDVKLQGIERQLSSNLISPAEAINQFNAVLESIPFIRDDPRPNLDLADGKIHKPAPKEEVEAGFTCSGVASGPNTSLWLAVEVGKSIWPKKAVFVNKDGTWSREVFEQGIVAEFDLSLWAADERGDRYIRDWFKRGDAKCDYPELQGRPGMVRLHSVSGLRLKKRDQPG
jgi:hypothetical protein